MHAKAPFVGTSNPRALRVLAALLSSPQTREAIDQRAGCSNGPDLVAALRREGLQIPCERTPCFDRDGREVTRGIYHLTAADKRLVQAWMRRRSKGGAS